MKLPDTMKAMVLFASDGLGQMVLREVSPLSPKATEGNIVVVP